ncbi:MAG: hypothetical protein OQK00_03755 [Rhodobacteraceae bacterium]|nr:hypothetical protein [Paracoccaceae bacterium]MCW9042507.1 hypothetical protein [Pseudopelagicola sp.]
MKANDLRQMMQVTDMRFRAERDQFRAICEEEKRLRRLLEGLDRRKEKARNDLAGDASMRLVGKDISWMNWADQHRRRLTAQLANTLARKEGAFVRFQDAYGRDAVLRRMLDRTMSADHAEQDRQDAERIEDDMILR